MCIIFSTLRNHGSSQVELKDTRNNFRTLLGRSRVVTLVRGAHEDGGTITMWIEGDH